MTVGRWTAFTEALGDGALKTALAADRWVSGLKPRTIDLSFGSMHCLMNKEAAVETAQAIVMVHGAASDSSCWVRFARVLQLKRPLILLDLPGHGLSVADERLNYGIASQADRVIECLRALGVERAHLVGSSMGGAVVLRLATVAPGMVSSLVLIDSAGAETTRSWLRRHAASVGRNPMIDVDSSDEYRQMLAVGMERPPPIPGVLISALTRAFRARRSINAKVMRDMATDIDQTSTLHTISAPTLIVWGRGDKVVHPDDAELLNQRIRDSRVVVLPGLGHMPMVEAPHEVAALVRDFYAATVRLVS
jgi:abhydrolase domain-containing protein 6